MLLFARSKKEETAAEFKNIFPFLKTIIFTVINVIRYQIKPLKLSFNSTKEAIETCHYSISGCARIQSQWDQRFLL